MYSVYAIEGQAVEFSTKQNDDYSNSIAYFGIPYEFTQSLFSQFRQIDKWNREHPLLGIEESERPLYFTRPIDNKMKERFEKSVHLYEKLVGKGNSSLLLDNPFSPEASLEYLMSYNESVPLNLVQSTLLNEADQYISNYINHNYSKGTPSLELRTLIFVLPIIGMPGDPKLSIGSKMKLPNGQIDELAGKKQGNWAAGYVSWAIGIPWDTVLIGANEVQRLQDLYTIGRKIWNHSKCKENCSPFQLDHKLGKDDPEGIKQVQAGRNYAFKQEYRKFLTSGRFMTSPRIRSETISNGPGNNSSIPIFRSPYASRSNSNRLTPKEKPTDNRIHNGKLENDSHAPPILLPPSPPSEPTSPLETQKNDDKVNKNKPESKTKRNEEEKMDGNQNGPINNRIP